LGNDAKFIPDEVFPFACGLLEADADNAHGIQEAAIEILGLMIGYAVEKVGDGWREVLALLLSKVSDPDVGLRLEIIRAIAIIAKWHPELLNEVAEVPELCFADRTDGLDAENDGVSDLIAEGFKLTRMLLKRFPGNCIDFFEHQVSGLATWGIEQIYTAIAMRVRAIIIEAISMAVQLHIIALEAGTTTQYVTQALLLIKATDDPQVVGAFLRGFRRLVKNSPEAMGEDFDEILKVALAAIKRELPAQLQTADVEGEFDYETEIQPAAQDVLAAGIRAYPGAFPMGEVLQTFEAIWPRLSELEEAALIGVVADWADVGGPVPNEWVELAFSKIEKCDFTVPSDPIFLVRVLITRQPEAMTERVPSLLSAFARILMSDVSAARYYWTTVTNVISAVLELAFSATPGAVPLNECMGMILAKLPVRGDYQEAQFIYDKLLVISETMRGLLVPHLAEFFRVVTQTLASPDRWFSEAKLAQETFAGLVRVHQEIAGGLLNCGEVMEEMLDRDPVKLATLPVRLSV
jgi:hypothetical protein